MPIELDGAVGRSGAEVFDGGTEGLMELERRSTRMPVGMNVDKEQERYETRDPAIKQDEVEEEAENGEGKAKKSRNGSGGKYIPKDSVPIDIYLEKYECEHLVELVKKTYSKLSAIDMFYKELREPSKDDFGDKVKIFAALITDQGILFPQTGEYGECKSYTMKSRKKYGKFLKVEADEPYERKLLVSQAIELERQIFDYREECRKLWSYEDYELIGLLQTFLDPVENEHGAAFAKPPKETDIEAVEGFKDDLFEIIQTYYTAWKGKKNKEAQIDKMSSYFAAAYYGEDNKNFCYIDRPDAIFYMIRSPELPRYINREKRYSSRDLIVRARKVPLSISTLKQDEKLFFGIVDACAKGCEQKGLPFSRDEWKNMWKQFVAKAIRATAFRMENMLIYPVSFGLLTKSPEMKKAFDNWLGKKIEGDIDPFASELFRTKYNQEAKYKKEELDKLTNIENDYKMLFVYPEKDKDPCVKYKLLDNYRRSFVWNQVKIRPSRSEKFFEIIKNADRLTKGENWADLTRLLTEWLIVQQFSHDATMKLLECAVTLSNKAYGR